ncbi:MAG: hypothetical protein H7832_09715 [Magnetococcus sp. DMHC-6]
MEVDRAVRIGLDFRVLLEFDHNRALIGITENVSDSGVFVTLRYRPVGVFISDYAKLHLFPFFNDQNFWRPCLVTRLTNTGIAVQFIEKLPENFRGSLKRNTTN